MESLIESIGVQWDKFPFLQWWSELPPLPTTKKVTGVMPLGLQSGFAPETLKAQSNRNSISHNSGNL